MTLHKTDLKKPVLKQADDIRGFLCGARGSEAVREDKENKPDKVSTFLLRIPGELRKQIKSRAAMEGTDMNAYITQAIMLRLEDK